MIIVSAVEVFGDIHILDPYLAVADIAESVDKARLSLAYRLYFSSCEHNTGGKCFRNGVVKSGSPVFYINIFLSHSIEGVLS